MTEQTPVVVIAMTVIKPDGTWTQLTRYGVMQTTDNAFVIEHVYDDLQLACMQAEVMNSENQ